MPVQAPLVSHYRLLERVPAADDDECYLALPGRPPRLPHFLRRFPGCSLAAGVDNLAERDLMEDDEGEALGPGAPLAFHRHRLAELLERGRWPRRRALAVETVYEIGESGGAPYVVTQHLPGADLRQIAEALRDDSRPLSWSLRLLLLIEASDVLAAQHYAGYAHPGIRAPRLRLTIGHGAPLALLCAYPLRREGAQLVVADPDHAAARLADRWALATAVLTVARPGHQTLMALADELRPPIGSSSYLGRWQASQEARRVLSDELMQRVHPHYAGLLGAYLQGDSGELPLPKSLADVVDTDEIEHLWRLVGERANSLVIS
ncbi:MAG: hypothetical protein CSA65_06310 [Proteobacteria bacterium]|nr:MAG: hypothetical protein CSA65_06310 [Pseudomonadota bacterium]